MRNELDMRVEGEEDIRMIPDFWAYTIRERKVY